MTDEGQGASSSGSPWTPAPRDFRVAVARALEDRALEDPVAAVAAEDPEEPPAPDAAPANAAAASERSGPGPGNAAASAVAAPTAAVALVSDGLASDGLASDGSAEDEMRRLRKRRNAVAFIKTTREYDVYQLAVAMHLARPCLEPDPAALPPIPKRSWEKSIQAWRNVLHAIDARWGDLVRFAESGGAVDGAAGGGGQ